MCHQILFTTKWQLLCKDCEQNPRRRQAVCNVILLPMERANGCIQKNMNVKYKSKCRELLLVWMTACVSELAFAAKKLGADPFSTNWDLNREQYRCTLGQVVPHFGQVLFSRSPDSNLRLEIIATSPLKRGQKNKLKARPPSWRADISGFMISETSKIGSEATQSVFNQSDSQKAYKALGDGFSLQLSLLHGTPPEPLEISIEGLGFNTMLKDFSTCQDETKQLQIADNARIEMEKKAADELARSMAKLDANSPKTAALTDGVPAASGSPMRQKLENLYDYFRVPFNEGDTELSQESSAILDQLLRRWELRGMPEAVALHGHADDAESTGSYINSDLRAQSVARYLVSKMPELQLRIEAHGDTLTLDKVSSQRVDVVPSDLPNWE